MLGRVIDPVGTENRGCFAANIQVRATSEPPFRELASLLNADPRDLLSRLSISMILLDFGLT